MTIVDEPDRIEPAATGGVATGREFLILITAMMATVAISIDLLLPAFGDLRAAFGMAPDSARVSWIVTAFFFGLAAGPLLYGPASDRFGRKPPLIIGMVLYLVGAVMAATAPTFGWLIAGRVIWGLGASAPRTLSLAMVRDRYSGDQMARLMSMIMAVFLLVPIFAPSVGALMLHVMPWRGLFWFQAVAGVALTVWSRRLPETLDPSHRRPFTLAAFASGGRAVLGERQTLLFTVALTGVVAAMTSYLSSLELILGDVYDRVASFPLIFGGIGVLLALVSLANARLVQRWTTRLLMRRMAVAAGVTATVVVAVVLATDGRPSFWLFVALLAALIPLIQGLGPNANTMAMQPVAHVAGTASAITSSVTMAVGSAAGGFVAGSFDGTARPFALGLAVLVSVIVAAVVLGTREPALAPRP